MIEMNEKTHYILLWDAGSLGLRTQRRVSQNQPRGSLAVGRIEVKCKPAGAKSSTY